MAANIQRPFHNQQQCKKCAKFIHQQFLSFVTQQRRNLATTTKLKSEAQLAANAAASFPAFKTDTDFNMYWNCIMRAEEDAMQKTRPWEQLELIPAFDRKKLLRSAKGECLYREYAFGKQIDNNAIEEMIKKINNNAIEELVKCYPVKDRKEAASLLLALIGTYHIKMFAYPFGPTISAPREIDPRIWGEAFAQAKLYLLGTAHSTLFSYRHVQELMPQIQPDIVFVELTNEKANNYELLTMTDKELEQQLEKKYSKENLDEIVKKCYGKKIADFGWVERCIIRTEGRQFYKKYIKLLAERKTCEFRAAMEMAAANKVRGCAGLVLGDFPSKDSEKINMKGKKKIEDFDEQEREIIWGRRDRYMTKTMHTMLHRCTMEKLCASHRIGVKFEPLTVFAIVGGSHLRGIEQLWSRPEEIYLPRENLFAKIIHE